MKYGLPYKGSKNRLAERIVELLPDGEHLIDLFCGGCAVTHYALLCGKYPHIHINDIDWRPVSLFKDALAGKYNDEQRWISREDFFRLKDTDPYVAIVWSFGNNMRDYLYSRQIEPLKRAIHFAMFYADYEPAREQGHDLSFIDGISDMQERYLAVKHYFAQMGHFQQQSFEGGELDYSPRKCRAGELVSLERGGYYSDLESQTPCGTATLGSRPTDARLKKKNEQRLQSHEQRRDLLQIAVQGASPLAARMGGEKQAHIFRRRLPRRGDSRRLRHLLRHPLQGNECLQQVRGFRLRGVLRLVLSADAARIHQQLRNANRPLRLHPRVRTSQHPVGIG